MASRRNLASGWIIAKGAPPAEGKRPQTPAELDVRFDEHRKLHASAMEAGASHASSAAHFIDRIPELRATLVNLLRLTDAGTLTGVWPTCTPPGGDRPPLRGAGDP